jgi:hypothetical protein
MMHAGAVFVKVAAHFILSGVSPICGLVLSLQKYPQEIS